MSETDPATPATETVTTEPPAPVTEAAPTVTPPADTAGLQAEIERWKALSRQNEKRAKSNAEAADMLTTLETRIADLETAKAAAERETAILRIAQEVGLPPSFATRIRGANEEELRTDATALKAALSASAPAPAAPGVGGPQGPPPAAKSVDEWRQYLSRR